MGQRNKSIRLAGLVLVAAVAITVAPLDATKAAPIGNGDVDGSGAYDVSDVIYLLGWLFLSGNPPVAIACPPPGGGPLPATGQTKCYGDYLYEALCNSIDFPGQDGFYEASCPKEYRFVDNGDGTVTDHCTGLIWQKDTADTNGDGSITEEDQLNWQDALQYCGRLDYAGYSDWRLPNVIELRSIVDYARTGGQFPIPLRHLTPDHAAMDPLFMAETPDFYWSSTSNSREPDKVWWVSFEDGHSGSGLPKNEFWFVRAVRVQEDTAVFSKGLNNAGITPLGNGDINGDEAYDVSDAVHLLGWLFLGRDPPTPIVCPPRGGGPLPATGQSRCYDELGEEIPCDSDDFPGQDGFYQAGCPMEGRFVDHGDGTVTDTCTGLMWQKVTTDTNGDELISDEDRLNWQDALLYCDRLDFAGHTDWRLPNAREFFSIVDHGRFDPAIDPIFGAVFGISGPWQRMYWTSTTHMRTPDDAWTITGGTGILTDCQKDCSDCDLFLRAVRDGL